MKKTRPQLSEIINSWRILTRGLALVAAMGLAGCVDSDEDSITSSDNFTRNSAAQIAQESADNYDNNVNGLISGSTLTTWIDDWEANRPAGISGDLVILHVSVWEDPGNAAAKTYITPDAANGVRSYAIDTDRLVETRSNGVINTRSMVPSAEQVNEFLADYNIDPNSDMIVWAMGEGGRSQAMRQGRGWYMLRYWGTEKEHLALLNGGANHDTVIPDTHKSTTVLCDENESSGCLPGGGTVTVRDLPEDNTDLQATLEDVMAVARGEVDAFLWDARSEGEYLGTAFRTGGMQGHPNNAVLLEYAALLVSDDDTGNGASYKYKPKADLETYMAGGTVTDNNGTHQFERYYSDSGNLESLRAGDIYTDGQVSITYCETTFRAMITGVASAVVLGMPNRFYDGAMTEWNHMAHIQTKNGDFLLPSDSPWRADKSALSFFVYEDPADIERQGEAELDDPYADNTNLIPYTDRSYKISGGSGSGSGSGGSDGGTDDGGGALPPNPCGG